jgi:phospholipase C
MPTFMRFFRAGASCLTALPVLFGFAGCGGGSSSPPPVPAVPSYTLTAGAFNPSPVTAGNRATSSLSLTPVNGYTGSIALSCGTISGGMNAPTCSFSPATVLVSGAGVGTSTLTVSTSAGTPGGSYAISVDAADTTRLAPSNGAQSLTLTTAAVIQHIVIIFQENRTPDNLFQDPVLISRGADIASSGKNSLGQTITLSPIDLGTAGTTPDTYDLSHQHDAWLSMFDGGKMDGADLIPCQPATGTTCPANPQFMYVKPADVQPYFALAEQYTFADRMFQTNEGPSFPAHQFILAGTSAPTATSPLFAAENMPASGDLAGCIALATTTVVMINAAGSETAQPAQYPCFEHPTLTDLLDTKGVTWRYYAPSAGSIWTAPDAIEHICQQQTVNGVLTCMGPIWKNNVVIPETHVLTDIADGNLQQVTWVIPNGNRSDHAKSNDGTGPAWVSSIVNAIGSSSYWANTAIIITWDDWGGWYDHVPPTKVISDGVSWGSGYVYGFRVPMIVVSPYAKPAYISHVPHDFGSILRLIETTFGLPSLGYADSAAQDDLADCFALTQAPMTFTQVAGVPPASAFINAKSKFVPPDDD